MRVFCRNCQEYTEHTPPTRSLTSTEQHDENGKMGDTSYLSSCRGIKSDYRTVECSKCHVIGTWDFAKD